VTEVYFSKYCNEAEIAAEFDETGDYRYLLTVPFNRRNSKHAVVIMKNPSNAGKQGENGKYISDDTVYRVLDYLFKNENNYSKVTILNLFPHIGGETNNIKDKIKTKTGKHLIKKNDLFIIDYLKELSESQEEYHLIAGWGAHSKITESLYKQRIKDFFKILKDQEVYRVGRMVGDLQQYPGHGKYWYDYKELLPYPSRAIQ
jgi:hypothetical protein